MTETTPQHNANPEGIAPLVNIAIAENAMARAQGRAMHLPGLVVMCGPSGYGKSVAAAWVKRHSKAYYVQANEHWTKKEMMKDLNRALGLQFKPSATIADMARAVQAQLEQSGRPLIIDEFDYVTDKNMVMSILSIYEGSRAAILLIGEENLPFKLKEWEKFHGRILDWFYAEPCRLPDARELARLYCTHIEVADDLLELLVEKTKGSTRRVSTNLEKVHETALGLGWEKVDLSLWGNRPIQTGEPPRRGA